MANIRRCFQRDAIQNPASVADSNRPVATAGLFDIDLISCSCQKDHTPGVLQFGASFLPHPRAIGGEPQEVRLEPASKERSEDLFESARMEFNGQQVTSLGRRWLRAHNGRGRQDALYGCVVYLSVPDRPPTSQLGERSEHNWGGKRAYCNEHDPPSDE